MFVEQRNVVQPGRTLRSGRRGQWFESTRSDHIWRLLNKQALLLCLKIAYQSIAFSYIFPPLKATVSFVCVRFFHVRNLLNLNQPFKYIPE